MKKHRLLYVLPALLIALPLTSIADDDDQGDRRGYSSHPYQRDVKETYYDGNCKIERKFKKNGEYKEKRKCGGPAYGAYQPVPLYAPAPVYLQGNPGITINGTIQLPR